MRYVQKDCKNKKKSFDASIEKSLNDGNDALIISSNFVSDDSWLIDSGCSYHMNPNKEWFTKYTAYDGGNVFFGDNITINIMGKGEVKLCFNDGRVKTLNDVLHILGLARNLLSVSNFNDFGMHVTFYKGGYRLVKGNIVVAKGSQFGTLFKLNTSNLIKLSNLTEAENICMLWHNRLGHIGENYIRTILNKKLDDDIHDYNIGKNDFYEHSVFGNQSRSSFPSGTNKDKRLLEIIHSDVMGPVDINSIGKSRYYVTFIDDVSRYTWIYFMHKTSDVFNKFIEFKALVEK